MLKKILTSSLLSMAIISQAMGSSAGNELKNVFSNLGFATNVTGSAAYHTQAAGYVSYGSVNARTEARFLQVAHVDAPGVRAGCGGIDVFAGGFSYITASEIVDFMKNILSNGGGYALNLALETELPEMASAMQFMQSIATKVNNFNMSSCELSESLVQGMWPKRRQAHQRLCEDIGMNKSIFSDWAKARQGCSTGSDFDDVIEKGNKDSQYKNRIQLNKNIVWEAIRSNEFLKNDTGLAEVYMSISGTLVFDKQGSVKTYPSLAVNRSFIKALLYGGKLPVYKCHDGQTKECLNIDYSQTTFQEVSPQNSLVSQVQALLNDIYQNIVTDTELTPEQVGLIAMSNKEVFRLLSANAEQGIGIQGAHVLSETLAAEILSQFLSNSVSIIRSSLAGKEMDKDSLNDVYSNLNRVQTYVDEIVRDSRQQFNEALTTNKLINDNVNMAMSHLGTILSRE